MTNKVKRKKQISKPSKQTKQKKQKKLFALQQQKKPRGKRECPSCKGLVGIRKYECQICGYSFPQKVKVVSKDSVFKKSSEKSIITILEHNLFNTLQKMQAPKKWMKEFKPVIKPIQNPKKVGNQEVSIRANSQTHKVKYYKTTSINKKYKVFAGRMLMKCIRINEYALVFSEQLSAEALGLSKFDESTVRMHGLQYFHKLGHHYEGESSLYISLTHLEKGFYKATIKRNIVQIQLRSNIAAILCGNGSVQFYVLPSHPETGEHIITLNEPTVTPTDNGITICWLNVQSMGIIVGDIQGNIKIFNLDQNLEPTLMRLFLHAHHNHITAIKCCPLNDQQTILFCSAGYDGSLKIWDHNQQMSIYQIDVTSKKINNVAWDNGGKFILIERDDACDGCSILTFFSTSKTEKTEKKQILVSECEQRYLKQYNSYEFLATSPSSNLCVFANSYGGMEICDLEFLRKSSIKKKSHGLSPYPFNGLNIAMEGQTIVISEEKVKIPENSFDAYEHIISDVSLVNKNGKDKIAISTYLGIIIILEK